MTNRLNYWMVERVASDNINWLAVQVNPQRLSAPAGRWLSAPAEQWLSAPASQWLSAPAGRWSSAPAGRWLSVSKYLYSSSFEHIQSRLPRFTRVNVGEVPLFVILSKWLSRTFFFCWSENCHVIILLTLICTDSTVGGGNGVVGVTSISRWLIPLFVRWVVISIAGLRWNWDPGWTVGWPPCVCCGLAGCPRASAAVVSCQHFVIMGWLSITSFQS